VCSETAGAFAIFIVVPGTIADMAVSTDIEPIPIQLSDVRDFAPKDKKEADKAKPAKKEKKEKPKSAEATADAPAAPAADAGDDSKPVPEPEPVGADKMETDEAEPKPASKPEPEPEAVKVPVGTDTIENLAQVASDYFSEASLTMMAPPSALCTVSASHEYAGHAAFVKWVDDVTRRPTDKPSGVAHRSKTLTLKDGTVVNTSAVSRFDTTASTPANAICVILSAKTADGDKVRHVVFTNNKLEEVPGNLIVHMKATDKSASAWREERSTKLSPGEAQDPVVRARVRTECFIKSLEKCFK
jgi:outer membrane biosynthesis protein TonB